MAMTLAEQYVWRVIIQSAAERSTPEEALADAFAVGVNHNVSPKRVQEIFNEAWPKSG
jgi:hypothetical protein